MIRYTEGKEESDLERRLLAQVGANGQKKSLVVSPSRLSGGADQKKTTTITLATVIDTQHSVVSMDDDEGEIGGFVGRGILGLASEDSSFTESIKVESHRHSTRESSSRERIETRQASSARVSTVSTTCMSASSAQRIIAQPLSSPVTTSTTAKTQTTVLRKSAVVSAGSGESRQVKRVPLVQRKTSMSPQYDPDFPDTVPLANKSEVLAAAGAKSSRPPLSRTVAPTAGARRMGLAASRAPSAAKPFVGSSSTASSGEASKSNVPLSEHLSKIAAASKKQRLEISAVDVDADEGRDYRDESVPSFVSRDDQPDTAVEDGLSTPKRQGTRPVSTGSSARRNDVTAPQGLGRLLAQARTRAVQDMTSMSLRRNDPAFMSKLPRLILRTTEVSSRSGEQLLLKCEVVDPGKEERLRQAEMVHCVVPLVSDQTKEELAIRLRNLKHLTVVSDLQDAVIHVFEPWKVMSNSETDMPFPLIVCSGLVTEQHHDNGATSTPGVAT